MLIFRARNFSRAILKAFSISEFLTQFFLQFLTVFSAVSCSVFSPQFLSVFSAVSHYVFSSVSQYVICNFSLSFFSLNFLTIFSAVSHSVFSVSHCIFCSVSLSFILQFLTVFSAVYRLLQVNSGYYKQLHVTTCYMLHVNTWIPKIMNCRSDFNF